MDRVWEVVCFPVLVLTPVWRWSRGQSSAGAAKTWGWGGGGKECQGWVPGDHDSSTSPTAHAPLSLPMSLSCSVAQLSAQLNCPRGLPAFLPELLWESKVGKAGKVLFQVCSPSRSSQVGGLSGKGPGLHACT